MHLSIYIFDNKSENLHLRIILAYQLPSKQHLVADTLLVVFGNLVCNTKYLFAFYKFWYKTIATEWYD